MTSWAFPSVGFQAWCWSLDQLSCSLMHSMGDTWGEHVTLFYHTHAHAHTRLCHKIWSCDFAINNPFGSTVSLRPTVANGGQRRRWHHIWFLTLFWLLCMGLGFYAECILSCKMWCCTDLYVTWYKFIKSNIVSIYYTREIEDTLLGRSFSPDLSFILCPAADGISRTVTPTTNMCRGSWRLIPWKSLDHLQHTTLLSLQPPTEHEPALGKVYCSTCPEPKAIFTHCWLKIIE